MREKVNLHFIRNLHIGHLHFGALHFAFRDRAHNLWVWVAFDPQTKLIPAVLKASMSPCSSACGASAKAACVPGSRAPGSTHTNSTRTSFRTYAVRIFSWMNSGPMRVSGQAGHDVWVWAAIDASTKIVPVLRLGPRTLHLAYAVVHELHHCLSPASAFRSSPPTVSDSISRR